MKISNKNIQDRLSSGLITTALALLILACVALFYDGTMICIFTVFETFGLCLVLQIVLWLIERWESKSVIFDLIARYTVIIVIVIIGGFLFHWLDNLPIGILIAMAIIIYFLGCSIEVGRVKAEVKRINQLTKLNEK